ncbi:hypothetical protein QE152_g22695 [Popillia japonica]|uniref:Uncharacterized protein n=1 Tax=Popillia japonica TaxID=7064 RepID=A0AAW1KJA4_POPJA
MNVFNNPGVEVRRSPSPKTKEGGGCRIRPATAASLSNFRGEHLKRKLQKFSLQVTETSMEVVEEFGQITIMKLDKVMMLDLEVVLDQQILSDAKSLLDVILLESFNLKLRYAPFFFLVGFK